MDRFKNLEKQEIASLKKEPCGELQLHEREVDWAYGKHPCDLPIGHAGSHRANGVRWILERKDCDSAEALIVRLVEALEREHYNIHARYPDSRDIICNCGRLLSDCDSMAIISSPEVLAVMEKRK